MNAVDPKSVEPEPELAIHASPDSASNPAADAHRGIQIKKHLGDTVPPRVVRREAKNNNQYFPRERTK
jgi:hypothetical protein